MVYPRGLASATAVVGVTRFRPSDRTVWEVTPAIRWGLTDRLELANLSLRYAFLDDAPAAEGGRPDGRRRGPLSLALQGGVEGIGWSSTEAFIVIPAVALAARKRLGSRAYLWARLDWSGIWISEPRPYFSRAYTDTLWPPGRSSRFAIEGGAVVQVVDHFALEAGVGGHQIHACFAPSCGWASRGVSAFVVPHFRPWRWMDVSVNGTYGTRERSGILVVPNPDPSQTPMPLRRISWLALSAALTLRW